MAKLLYSYECLTAYELREELEAHARFGPGPPNSTLVRCGDTQITSFGVEEETLSDGSKVYTIVLGGQK